MHVNELAKRANVPAHVIRYYTQIGLLIPNRDPSNRYREYSDSDVQRVNFVRRARLLGFTLQDVKTILGDADRGVSPCPEVRSLIRLRIAENRQRLQELQQLLTRMNGAMELWETMPDKKPDHEKLCHLIDAVAYSE